MTKIDKDLCEDYDDDGELDVEFYPVPAGLIDSMDEMAMHKSLSQEIGSASGQAGNRAPGPGLGVNFVIFPPKKKKGTGYTPSAREMVCGDGDGDDDSTGAMHSKKEDYDFHDRYSQVRPYVYPEQYREAHKDARKGSKDRMEAAKKTYADNIMMPKNKAEVAR
jgi:hypothetical protein